MRRRNFNPNATPAELEFDNHNINIWEVSDTAHAFGIIAHLGESFGRNLEKLQELRQIDEALSYSKTPKDLELTALTHWYDDENFCTVPGTVTKTAEEWITLVIQHELKHARRFNYDDTRDWSKVTSFKDLKAVIRDYYDDADLRVEGIFTKPELEAHEKKKERVRLETAARKIADANNVAPGSMEFIKLCYRILNRQESYREGLREDGLCIGYGVTIDQWCDEVNASRSDTQDVRDILDWLSQHCPMLWAEYEESRKNGTFDPYEVEEEV